MNIYTSVVAEGTQVWIRGDVERFDEWMDDLDREGQVPEPTVTFTREELNELVVRHLSGPMGPQGPTGSMGHSAP